MITLEEARAKALAYGRGEIPLTSLPPQTIHKSQSGMCDYCNKVKSVVMKTTDELYLVCWTDVCRLKEVHGEAWEQKAENTLFRNRQNRLQLEAQKVAKKKGNTNAGF